MARTCTVLVEQRQGRVPVEQGDGEGEAGLDGCLDDVVVVGHAGLVDGALAEGEDARPADARAEGWDTECLEPGDVLLVQVVVRSNDITRGIVGNDVGHAVGQQIPDRRTLSFGVCGALRCLVF